MMSALVTDIVTKDAAYLSACIERFRSAQDGCVRVPLDSAELLLRNYFRILGQLSQPEENGVGLLSMESTMQDLMVKWNTWFAKMKIQQDEAMLAAKRASSGSPIVPPSLGGAT